MSDAAEAVPVQGKDRLNHLNMIRGVALLKYFLSGPFEWLWRSQTYVKKHPMRRATPGRVPMTPGRVPMTPVVAVD